MRCCRLAMTAFCGRKGSFTEVKDFNKMIKLTCKWYHACDE